jgi:tetratricopeptide (TPR) repeat protein
MQYRIFLICLSILFSMVFSACNLDTARSTEMNSPISPLVSPLQAPAAGITPLLDEADRLFESGQYESALALYTQALEDAPGRAFWRAHAGRGNIYSAWRRFNEASDEYSRSLEYARTPVVLISRCNAYRLLHRYEMAFADCEEALQLEPNSADARIVLASIYLDQGASEEARKQVEVARTARPDSAEAFFMSAAVEMAEGNLQSTVEYLSQAIALDPSEPTYYWERGFLYLSLGEVEKARADLKSVLDVGDPVLHGEVMLRAGTQLQILGE